MPDSEAAIRAFNGLRRHLPLLQALAANSPFRNGRDTGLASAAWLQRARSRCAAGRARACRARCEVLEEGAFGAARFGVTAKLPAADGRLRPVAELLDEALALTGEDARACTRSSIVAAARRASARYL